jgi:hypothetical protein
MVGKKAIASAKITCKKSLVPTPNQADSGVKKNKIHGEESSACSCRNEDDNMNLPTINYIFQEDFKVVFNHWKQGCDKKRSIEDTQVKKIKCLSKKNIFTI